MPKSETDRSKMKGHVGVSDKFSHSVGRPASGVPKDGIFESVPLPGGRTMRVLDRKVFDAAVQAAMKAKRSA